MTAPVVLVVDDEPGLLRLFTRLLERLECQAVGASSGEMALEILEEMTPDLLILDLAMPEMNGHQVLQEVRRLPHLDTMKVMILTARPNMVPEVESLGIDCWVSKPIMPHDFLDIVGQILDTLY